MTLTMIGTALVNWRRKNVLALLTARKRKRVLMLAFAAKLPLEAVDDAFHTGL